MKTFSYIKINGAGNDFVLIDKKQNPGIVLSNLEIAQICNRVTGIGADGVLFIEDSNNTDFSMQYFNADGTTGSLCGNGARCAIKYAELSNRLNGTEVLFLSNDQTYRGEVLSDSIIRFYLNSPSKIKLNFKVKAYGQLISAHFADTGSPHVVIFVDQILRNPQKISSGHFKIEQFPVEDIGKKIRNLPEFAPNGTNVNFISESNGKLIIRSYERGVEAETLACGTGSVASAIIYSLIYKKNAPIELITKSNAELIVNFRIEKNTIDQVSLTGPVEIEHEGKYSI